MAVSGLRCSQQPRDVRLIRDHITNTSRGFCFLEFNTTEVTTDTVHVHVYMYTCNCRNAWKSFFLTLCRMRLLFCTRYWSRSLRSLWMASEVGGHYCNLYSVHCTCCTLCIIQCRLLYIVHVHVHVATLLL